MSNENINLSKDYQNFNPSDRKDLGVNANQYTAEISRTQPTAILFLVDQSGSMSNSVSYNNAVERMDKVVAEIVNNLIRELIGRCTKSDGVRPYFQIAGLGYGNGVCNLWENFSSDAWLSTTDLADKGEVELIEKEVSIRGGKVLKKVERQTWIKPKASSLTPMGEAIRQGTELIREWTKNYPDSFPPIVFNITDGAATDINNDNKVLIGLAHQLKLLSTNDGNVLMFNIHLSSGGEQNSILFPYNRADVEGDSYAEVLFDMSSVLPQLYNMEIAKLKGVDMGFLFVAMAMNTPPEVMVSMLNIGTMGTNQLIK